LGNEDRDMSFEELNLSPSLSSTQKFTAVHNESEKRKYIFYVTLQINLLSLLRSKVLNLALY
jgi:hypothetical protein